MEKEAGINSVDIHYEKNPQYRTIHTDGAIGGVSPIGMINLAFYSTRHAIPKSINQKLNPDGSMSQEPTTISEDSKSGVIREIEFGVYMNKQTAQDLYNYLKNIFENEHE